MFIESRFMDTSRRIDKPGENSFLNSLGFRNEEDFLQWLGEDQVLDLGSGYGTLAKNVAKKKGRAQVVSLNPSLDNPDFLKESRLRTKELANEGDADTINFLDQAHESLAVPGRWDQLPFEDASFSKILSSYAFPMYCKTQEELFAAVKELNRVLRPGGEIRINAPQASSISDKSGVVIPRDKFYNAFKKVLESQGFVVKEMSEYNPDLETAINSVGGGRLYTVDHPFFLSITKPEEVQKLEVSISEGKNKSLIQFPANF